MSGALLELWGLNAVVRGDILAVDGFQVRIIGECSALFVLSLFSAFVLAYPTSWRHKAIGLCFGIPFLVATNVTRIAAVTITGTMFPDLFRYVHVYLGQIVMILLVFFSSLAWLTHVVVVGTNETPSAFFIRVIAFSSILFMAWLYLTPYYLAFNEAIIRFAFSFRDRNAFVLDRGLNEETFNLICFTALMLATRSIGGVRKIKGLFIGLVALLIVNLPLHICLVLVSVLQVRSGFLIGNAMIFLGQYVLPLALWLGLTHKDLWKWKDRKEKAHFRKAEHVI